MCGAWPGARMLFMDKWRTMLAVTVLLCGGPHGCSEGDPGTGSEETTTGGEAGDEDFEAVFDVTSLFDMADITDPGKLNLELKKDVVQLDDGGLAWVVPFAGDRSFRGESKMRAPAGGRCGYF